MRMKAAEDELNKLSELYDRDFVLWTEEQAAALRRAKDSNLPLDWANLAEEIESLGKSDRRALRSQITRVLRHLLKLEVSTAAGPRAGWRETIVDARTEIELVLEDSPSLRRDLTELIEKLNPIAAKLACSDLAQHDEPAAAVWERAKQGFTAEQVLGDWFPDPPAEVSKTHPQLLLPGSEGRPWMWTWRPPASSRMRVAANSRSGSSQRTHNSAAPACNAALKSSR